MLKSIKYSLLFFAAFVVLLHNVIPHVHEEKLSDEQDQRFHENEETLPFNFLVLAFHEFTEDGQMEDFVAQSHHINLNVDVVKDLVSPFKYFSFDIQTVVFERFLTTSKLYIHQLLIPLDSGIKSAWAVRPPPMA